MSDTYRSGGKIHTKRKKNQQNLRAGGEGLKTYEGKKLMMKHKSDPKPIKAQTKTKQVRNKKVDNMQRMNELPKPKSGGKPKKITTPGKPGDSGPGGAHPGRNKKPKRKGKEFNPDKMSSEQKKRVDDEVKRRGW